MNEAKQRRGRTEAKKGKKESLLSWLLIVILAVSMLPALGGTTLAAEYTTIIGNTTLNDGDTILGTYSNTNSTISITGGPDAEDPVIVTVHGTVTVRCSIVIASGYVKFCGGGTLRRGTDPSPKNTYPDLFSLVGGNLTMENITLDGNGSSSQDIRSHIKIDNPDSTFTMNAGTILQNNYNSQIGTGASGTVLVNAGRFIMNGGQIINNKNGIPGGAAVVLNGNATSPPSCIMAGGTISGNTDMSSPSNTGSIYIRRSASTVTLTPKADISISGVFTKHSSASSANIIIEPQAGYDISSVTVDGNLATAATDGKYKVSTISSSLVVDVAGGETAPVSPEITSQPAGGTYSVGDSASLTVSIARMDDGELSYQWYRSTDNSSSTPADDIAVGMENVYTVSTDTVGTMYYYCVVTNTLNSQSASMTSAVAEVNVTGRATEIAAPEITIHPVGGIYSIGADATLAVSAISPDGGELSYQWYSSADNTAATASDDIKVGTNSTSYTPSTATAGMMYYYCIVINTLGSRSVNIASDVAQVTVAAPLDAPEIMSQPVGGVYRIDADATLTVAATGTGDLSYEWYSSTDRTADPKNDTAVGTESNYRPSTATAGTTYYYCVVTNTLEGKTSSTTSKVVSIVVTSGNVNGHKITSIAYGKDDAHHTYSILVNGISKEANLTPGATSYGIAQEGDTVTLVLSIENGYALQSIAPVGGQFTLTASGDSSYSFTMPAGDVVFRVITQTKSTCSVTIVAGSHGTVSTNADSSFAGGMVTVTAAPDTGYRVKNVSYSIDGGTSWVPVMNFNGSTGTFDTIASNTLITAAFVENPGTISISSESELTAFEKNVNAGDWYSGATLALSKDIALTTAWTPVGSGVKPFMGTFDGGGHTISGLNVTTANGDYAGLFGYVCSGTIKNLKLKGTVKGNAYGVGSVAGVIAYNSQILNCSSSVNVTNTNTTVDYGYAGGLAGASSYYAGSVQNCYNYGSISSANGNAGGILGRSDNTLGKGSISDCGNYGSVYGMIAGAGIAAILNQGTVESCVNKGSVAVSDTAASGAYAGGIVARVGGSNAKISNCYNTGDVSGYSSAANRDGEAYTGGIFSGDRGSAVGIVITNCYNTGKLTKAGKYNSTVTRYGEITPMVELIGSNFGGWKETTVAESSCKQVDCYTASQLKTLGPAAAQSLGAAYKTDSNAINKNATPLLAWEESTLDTTTQHQVYFSVNGAENSTIKVYTDSARTTEVSGNSDGSYNLTNGEYYYTVSADNFVAEKDSFTVYNSDKTISLTLREAAAVTFTLTPASATLVVTAGVKKAEPVSQTGGIYVYSLYADDNYTYTVTASGYNGTTREFVATDSAITVALTPSGQVGTNPAVNGGSTISTGGTYNLTAGATGNITISTTSPVTLVGAGVSISDAYKNLYIKCTTDGVKLTLDNVYISNNIGTANMIDFTGDNNRLYFAGINILDMDTGATGYAMIHVNMNTSLTLGGVSDDDILYFYKKEQGAGIGGNGGADGGGQSPEYNGNITITGGNLFMKNSKQGALIGSGASASKASGNPGNITVKGGILNLITVSRGSAIGGSAGSKGGATGTNVYVYPSASININVDYSGSAIGGGGFDEGNDSDGGTLHYSGGSIRTFIDYNAVVSDGVNLWKKYGVTKYGVNDAAITADKVNDSGKKVYLCGFDTSKLTTQASDFKVLDGSTSIYQGGLHEYHYVNESLQKNRQHDVTYTMDNWDGLVDSNLYLYLTGEDHMLKVNGETFKASWDNTKKTFTLTKSLLPVIGSQDTQVKTVAIEVKTSGKTSTATVSAGTLSDAVSVALSDAKKADKKAAVELSVNAPEGSTTVNTVVPKSSLADAAKSGITGITVTTPIGAMTFDSKALATIAGQASGADITLSLQQVDNKTLTPEQQKVVGSGTVVDLSVISGSKAIHDFGGGSATVIVPYTLKTGETGDGIVIWYLADDGTLTQVEGAAYNSSSKAVTFKTSHFSNYVIGYDPVAAWKNPFADVKKTDWFYADAYYVYAGNLFKGTSDTAFSPNMPMTRAMFVTALGRLAGVKTSDYTTSSYSDVTAGKWYGAYVEWAAQNGIVTGVGDKRFNPEGKITREEMAAILYRYAKFTKADINASKDLADFTDGAKVSDWANDGMKWAVGKNLINGMGDGTLAPRGTATRAQVAAIIHRLATR